MWGSVGEGMLPLPPCMTREARALHRGLPPPPGDWPGSLSSPLPPPSTIICLLLSSGTSGCWRSQGRSLPWLAVGLLWASTGPDSPAALQGKGSSPVTDEHRGSDRTGDSPYSQLLAGPVFGALQHLFFPWSCPLCPAGPGTQGCGLRCPSPLPRWLQEGCRLPLFPGQAPGIHSVPPSWPGSALAAVTLVGMENRTLLMAALPAKLSLSLRLLSLKMGME